MMQESNNNNTQQPQQEGTILRSSLHRRNTSDTSDKGRRASDEKVRRVSINVPPPTENTTSSNGTATRKSTNHNGAIHRQGSSLHERRSISSVSTGILRRARRNSSCSMHDAESVDEATSQLDVHTREMKKMDRTVLFLRLAVLLTLVIAATVVATLTFIYVKRDETDDFKNEYHSAVIKVVEGFQNGVNTKVWSASAFSAMYTSRYGGKGNTWPNATMPHFQQQASGQLQLSNGRALSFNPIINNQTRAQWEAHATESASILGADQLVNRTCTDCRIVADGIYRKVNGTAMDDPGYTPQSEKYPTTLVPVWQIAPIEGNERAVMFNLHSETNRQRALDDMLTHKVPVLTAIIQLVQDSAERPSSILFYPVIASFTNTTNSTKVVGSISIVFSWDQVLERILPNYLKGVVCVLATNTGQEYTFKLDGDQVKFLGKGDQHDSKYDDMEVVVDANVEGTSEELGKVDYLINYHLRCYPSKEFEDQYLTTRPIIYTLVGVMIFVFTAALFLFYDYLVEHRQTRVSRAAERTGRIVNSMFPAAFRDRLFQQHENSTQERRPSIVSQVLPTDVAAAASRRNSSDNTGQLISQDTSSSTHSKPRQKDRLAKSMKKFLKVTTGAPDYNVGANMGSTYAEDPIADLFSETSIMFCDLVGFTSWCANQSPNQVFCLLESLFWEFDQLAQQYGVFKLGTIGDCYIAVTGLPDPMEQHASVLAEFTIQCKKKVEEVRRSLQHTHCNWQHLNMRFGIHSGPVTAGILRGQKSRFELFGDTINTASRMESTSKANCIQVSQETAELLRMEGMGSWLAPRQGLVSVKGKGNLSTFWLIPPEDEGNGGVPDELIANMSQHLEQMEVEEEEETIDNCRPRKRSSVLVPFTVTGSFENDNDSNDKLKPMVDPIMDIDDNDDMHSWSGAGDTESSTPSPTSDVEAGLLPSRSSSSINSDRNQKP